MCQEGISAYHIKKYLQLLYNINSKELDNGVGVPYSVYCIKPYAKINNKWLPYDTCKIGKATSIANRTRCYSQAGGDIRTLWMIEVLNKGYAESLERAIHKFCEAVHDNDSTIIGTELFTMSAQEAFTTLFNFINDNTISKYGITSIITFENNCIDRLTTKLYSSTGSTQHKKKQNHSTNLYYTLYDEVPPDTTNEDIWLDAIEKALLAA